ncbi:hypothetical protein ACEQ8H_004550 [Pleosporales sp. CAS-2024a]
MAPAGQQARPITGFYAEMLKKATSEVQPLTKTMPEPPPPEPRPKTQKEQTLEKARIVFGSKLAGPAERRTAIEAASQVIAGVVVPAKPAEPDNCCMSGCVNCVWDLYRDDMEEWAEKSAQARAAMQANDDGGGSESNRHVDSASDASSLFDEIPVGIREFMKTEKKLKMLKMQQRAAQDASA